jgi:3'-phosphoadenosine 5'-phosphosulfate sulfotransferase (PAPS reductase)/FAD synthetase
MTHTMAPEQLSLFAEQPVPNRFPVVTSPIVSDLLAAHAPVALGVSGGKDSGAMALAVTRYLDERGHRGPRLLIHSDLGRVEWRESLPMCQQLADHLGLELVVVRRQAGDLLDRWQVRWRTNVARYADLETVRLILPWSTPGEESAARAAAPISAPQPRLSNQTHRTSGHDWHPIVEWTREQVLAYHSLRRFPLHPAYGQGMTRVSCAYCVMSSLADLQTSARCPENQELYRELVELEILSSFAFQSGHWLGDIAPWLLSESQQRRLAEAKRRAAIREQAEARIPCHLLYTKGWPTSIPTMEEAALLAEVRRIVAETLELSIDYRDPEAIRARYAELMDARPQKASREMASHAQASVERTRQPLLLGSFERRGEDA